MLFLTEADVLDLLPMAAAVKQMEAVFNELAGGESLNQPRRRLILPTGSILHYMAGSFGDYFGTKIYSTNPKFGAHFLFLLYAAADAKPLALFEANYLGQIRTGAASGYATKILAREDAVTLGIIGTGFQAQTQVAAMLAVRAIQRVRVWSRSEERRKTFARECAKRCGVEVTATDTAEAAIRGADIVVTATNSREPVLQAAWVGSGTHINAMGSNQAQRRELPSELVLKADLIAVDSIEQARMESGDFLLAIDPDQWAESNIVELSEVSGRPSLSAVTIFKSNGIAAEDVASAAYIYEKALQEGRGQKFQILKE